MLDIKRDIAHNPIKLNYLFHSCCVKKWEDPHDSVVYCIESDQKWMILSGTYRYGVVGTVVITLHCNLSFNFR